jgi:hypothetical protein
MGSSKKRRPTSRDGPGCCRLRKGVQVAWKFGASCSSERPIPAGEAGIEPIEGVLDRNLRGFKRHAAGVVLARAVATPLERMAKGSRRRAWKTRRWPLGATGDVRSCGGIGRPFQPKGAGGQDTGEIPGELTPKKELPLEQTLQRPTGRTQVKPSRRKTALSRLRLAARTAGADQGS